VLAQGVRARIEAMLPYRIGELAEAAGRLRERVAHAVSAATGRRSFWHSFFFGPVADAFFSNDRRPYEVAIDNALAEAAQPQAGRVSFLTAPSDPELLTLKAHRKLQEADVIVHDRQVDPRLLDYARRDASRVPVDSAAPDLLLRQAGKGRHVVRLRSAAARLVASSAPELTALAAASIPVDIVPAHPETAARPATAERRAA
jgi:uroporphyrin-III C-methyltransferase/precorrin-2 dehydrogenase/sirohydrochlorin ferrochelatase